MKFLSRIVQAGRNLLPVTGFFFDRPIVVFQSDDWGRVGVRDREGLEELRARGIALGERPYDYYSLETADDVAALMDVLHRHRDNSGRNPCVEMNFIVANLDFPRLAQSPGALLALADGLPGRWTRPQLLEAYRAGIAAGLFSPALHGTTHFCRAAVEAVEEGSERQRLLQSLWQAETPYIHWRMPWIGYEYWHPEKPEDDRFLNRESQRLLIGQAVGAFAKLFGTLPRSACAPGYRANDDTHRAWAQHGVRIAQNGPSKRLPPHFGRSDLLNLTRTVEFEPAVSADFALEECLRRAEDCFQAGIPAIVSMHSINFHSTIQDFRSRTIRLLDEFLSALETRHSDLLYLRDEELRDLITKGNYEGSGAVRVRVTQRKIRLTSI